VRPLPSKIDFGIAVIHIHQVGVKEMKELAEVEDGDPIPDGCWDADTDGIYILRKLSARRKKEVLFHEMVHAAVDNQYWAKHA